MKQNFFRLAILLCSVFLFSFSQKQELRNSKSLKGDETSRRLWGWGCPSCVFTGLGTNPDEMNYVCTSTYYVLGVGVTSSVCDCIVVPGSTGCPQCNNSNLNCPTSIQ